MRDHLDWLTENTLPAFLKDLSKIQSRELYIGKRLSQAQLESIWDAKDIFIKDAKELLNFLRVNIIDPNKLPLLKAELKILKSHISEATDEKKIIYDINVINQRAIVMGAWEEDFVDEDTGEVIKIIRTTSSDIPVISGPDGDFFKSLPGLLLKELIVITDSYLMSSEQGSSTTSKIKQPRISYEKFKKDLQTPPQIKSFTLNFTGQSKKDEFIKRLYTRLVQRSFIKDQPDTSVARPEINFKRIFSGEAVNNKFLWIGKNTEIDLFLTHLVKYCIPINNHPRAAIASRCFLKLYKGVKSSFNSDKIRNNKDQKLTPNEIERVESLFNDLPTPE